MKQKIWSCKDYDIISTDSDCLYDMATFVVNENYSHHSSFGIPSYVKQEINDIYQEELAFASSSRYYIVYDNNKRIVGSIRVFKWDCNKVIPMQVIFNVSPYEKIESSASAAFWHIGRFAIDSNVDFSTIKLFKQLMVLAIAPIINESGSYMLAETDAHLLRVMNALGIKTRQLGNPKMYLSSETVPIYSNYDGLVEFYNRYKRLLAVC